MYVPPRVPPDLTDRLPAHYHHSRCPLVCAPLFPHHHFSELSRLVHDAVRSYRCLEKSRSSAQWLAATLYCTIRTTCETVVCFVHFCDRQNANDETLQPVFIDYSCRLHSCRPRATLQSAFLLAGESETGPLDFDWFIFNRSYLRFVSRALTTTLACNTNVLLCNELDPKQIVLFLSLLLP